MLIQAKRHHARASERTDNAAYLLPNAIPRELYSDLPDFGYDLISPERFTNVEYMELEWRNLWSRVWLCGPHVDELREPGDFVVEELGRQSLIFVRDRDGGVGVFHNVCPHRGNQILTRSAQGNSARLNCRYHGWQFGLDGNCISIPDLEEFPQFACGANQRDVALSPVCADQWNGFVWFNLETGCGPLMDHIGALADHIAPYQIEHQRLIAHVTFEWPCNWKIAADAFNEAYHFAVQHPEMMRYGDDMPEFEFMGDHSVMKIDYGTVSQKLSDRTTISPHMREWMATYYGLTPETYSGSAKDVAREHCRRVRAGEVSGKADYARLSDRQITEDWAYMCFPNTSWNVMPEGGAGYRYRPHPTDPNRCFYDLYLYGFGHGPERPPRVARKRLSMDADFAAEIPELPRQGAVAIKQDMASVGFVQNGMHSLGFRGQILGNQELRLRHFYSTLDRYIARNGVPSP